MSTVPDFKIVLKKPQKKQLSLGYRPISVRMEIYNQIAFFAEETGLAVSDITGQLLTAALEHVVIEGE